MLDRIMLQSPIDIAHQAAVRREKMVLQKLQPLSKISPGVCGPRCPRGSLGAVGRCATAVELY